MDVTRRPAGKWIVDFGHEASEADAALYETPFAHILKHVKPTRNGNKRKNLRDSWWRHDRSGQSMFENIGALSCYMATPRVAKHRLFAWLDDCQLIVIARDDDTTSCTTAFRSVVPAARKRHTPRPLPSRHSRSRKGFRPTFPPLIMQTISAPSPKQRGDSCASK